MRTSILLTQPTQLQTNMLFMHHTQYSTQLYYAFYILTFMK